MRTTLDLDNKLMRRIRQRALEENKSLKEVINRSLARALEADSVGKKRGSYKCPDFSMGKPRVELDRAIRLADQLEEDAITLKLAMRK